MRPFPSLLVLLVLALTHLGCSYIELDVLFDGAAKDRHTLRFGESVTLRVGFEGKALADTKFKSHTIQWARADGSVLGTGSPFVLRGLPPGDHWLHVQALDRRGQAELHEAHVLVRVENDAPSLTLVGPSGVLATGSSETLEARASDREDGELSGSALVWFLDGTEVARGKRFRYQPMEAGTHEVRVVATDRAGARTSSALSLSASGPTPAPAAAGAPAPAPAPSLASPSPAAVGISGALGSSGN